MELAEKRDPMVLKALKDADIDPDDLNEMILVVSPGSTLAPADLVTEVNRRLNDFREQGIPIKAVGLDYY